jgi:N-acetylglucosaminyldiphosphoundecaprenol N-acetyl-beta-D-mannosaminyltransferase
MPIPAQAPAYATDLESLVAILGVPFHQTTLAGAVESIDAMIAGGGTHYVVTPNVDFLVKAQRDNELRKILIHADLVLCDGKPIVWASRLLGGVLASRVAGSDLIPLLLQRSADKGWRIFLLGGSPDVAARAARRIALSHPTLPKVAHYSPPYGPLEKMDNEAILEQIRSARPDIMLVCFGCPKQEKWISRNLRFLDVPVVIAAGATVDFLAGSMARAPVWMQRAGLEWIFRLIQEPRRLARRYADDLLHFLPAVLRQRWHQRPASAPRKLRGQP